MDKNVSAEVSWVDREINRFKERKLLIPERQRHLYEKIRDYWISGRTVMDVGCSLGVGSNILSQSARFVWGVDVNQEAVDFARLAFTRPNLAFEVLDIESPPTREFARFEVVVASEILEHLSDIDGGLNTIKRFFSEKGNTIGFMTAPNGANPEVVENEKKHGFHLQHYDAGKFYEIMTKHFQSVTMYSVDKLDQWEQMETCDGSSTDYLIVAKVEGIK